MKNLSKFEQNLIEKHRKEQEKVNKLLEAAKWEPKKAEEYTSEQKCKAFDELHKMALQYYNTAREEALQTGSCFLNEDFDHYAAEAVVQLLGKDVYKYLNVFTG